MTTGGLIGNVVGDAALRIQGDRDHAKRPTINHPKLYLHGQIGKALNLQAVAVPTGKHPAGFDSDQFGLHLAVIDICFIQQELCRVGAAVCPVRRRRYGRGWDRSRYDRDGQEHGAGRAGRC